MTCTPTISILKSSISNVIGGSFQPSTATVSLIVDYCGACADPDLPPSRHYQVMEDVAGSWDIVVGRPLAQIDGAGVRDPWISAYSGDMTYQEVVDVNAGTKDYAYYYVKNYQVKLVEDGGQPGVWRIDINLSMMTTEDSNRYPHCSVDVQTTSRMASAWRMGPGTSTDPFKIPTTNITATGPLMGSINNGHWEPKYWRGQVAAYQEVGGYDIDLNGNPMSVAIEQIRFTVSFLVRKPYLDLMGSGVGPPTGTLQINTTWEEWVQNAPCYVNKRNDSEMFGFRPGELLCESISSGEINEQFNKVTIVFSWDEWGHFDQQIYGGEGTLGGLSDQNYAIAGTIDRPMATAFSIFWTTSYHEAFRVVGMSGLFPMGVWSIAEDAFKAPTCYYPA